MSKPKSKIKKPYVAATLIVFLLLAVSAHASWNITNCNSEIGGDGVLNESGAYYLLNDCDGQLAVESNDIFLDCQGFSIIGTSPISTTVVPPPFSNMTIENCHFLSETLIQGGLYLDSLSASTIKNNTFLNYSFHPTNGYGGIEFDLNYGNVSDNYVYNNTFYNDSISFYSESSGYFAVNNHFYNNTFYGPPQLNIVYGNDILFNNWNETVGNWWYGFSDNETLCGTCNDGICSNPYVFDENNTDFRPLCIAAEEPCVPSWNCTAWGECIRGTQTRTCYDTNYCDDNSTIPALSQECVPNATANFTDGCCPISTFRCLNNDTVIQLWNTSDGDKWAVKDCQGLGCQNGECNYPTWINNVIILIIVGVVLYLIYRVV